MIQYYGNLTYIDRLSLCLSSCRLNIISYSYRHFYRYSTKTECVLSPAGRLSAAFFLHAAEGEEGFVVKGGKGVFAYHPFGARGIVCAEHEYSFPAKHERVKV